MTVAPLTATVLADADESDAGIASAVNNAVARVAGLIGVSVIGVVVAGALVGDTFAPNAESVDAFHEVIADLRGAGRGRRRRGRDRHRQPATCRRRRGLPRRPAGRRAEGCRRDPRGSVDLQLNGKVAVVTGASKGIGLAVTRALADEGAQWSPAPARTGALEGIDGVTAVAVDLAAPDGPAQLVERALDEHGRLDVLVNNVGGVRLRLDGFLGTSDEEFEWAMRDELLQRPARHPGGDPHMVEQGGGAIVNVASVNAFFQPDAGTIDYGAAKAALRQPAASRSPRSSGRRASTSTASRRARSPPTCGSASTASPTTVAAGHGRRRRHRARAASSRASAGFATGRFTTPEEVATLVVMLASSAPRNVTGANYVIDGGLIKTV